MVPHVGATVSAVRALRWLWKEFRFAGCADSKKLELYELWNEERNEPNREELGLCEWEDLVTHFPEWKKKLASRITTTRARAKNDA